MPTPHASMADRLFFWSYLCPKSGCWIWIGKISRKGYGHVSVRVPGIGPRNRMAHRVAFEQLTGRAIPPDMTLDHTCRNTRCINPAHLEIVTREENTRRRNAA